MTDEEKKNKLVDRVRTELKVLSGAESPLNGLMIEVDAAPDSYIAIAEVYREELDKKPDETTGARVQHLKAHICELDRVVHEVCLQPAEVDNVLNDSTKKQLKELVVAARRRQLLDAIGAYAKESAVRRFKDLDVSFLEGVLAERGNPKGVRLLLLSGHAHKKKDFEEGLGHLGVKVLATKLHGVAWEGDQILGAVLLIDGEDCLRRFKASDLDVAVKMNDGSAEVTVEERRGFWKPEDASLSAILLVKEPRVTVAVSAPPATGNEEGSAKGSESKPATPSRRPRNKRSAS